VPTYESAGLYWSRPGANATTGCEVKFRKAGDTAWTDGLAMWFDSRDNECRGSLVGLEPGTPYEAQLNLPGSAASRMTTFATWPNTLRIARTVVVRGGSGTLDIREGGSASTGYVLYDGDGATLDAANSAAYNVSVNASYVIVRGLTLKGAQPGRDPHLARREGRDDRGQRHQRLGAHARRALGTTWTRASAPSADEPPGARHHPAQQIHDPRYGANSWSDGHPEGPQAITISYCGGNHVIRHNEMYSTPATTSTT
jgi:hypothetical protein